ncbi:MAG: Gfo/Idh/MocA family oxidoreductase [Ruminococcaceae bacterium]|nr:Gfo/Idh/MocA family oxidoreductase [Oscillospiraceae bacterium]
MSEFKPIKVGLIGCGQIASSAYMPTILKKFNMVDVVKFADTIPERAELFAKTFGGVACTNEEIYNDPEIEVVLNLTFPTSHYKVCKAAILAGKHVHCEKMMAVDWAQGKELVDLAEEKGVYLTFAPDTFLGGAWQTCRHLIDTGAIGQPLAAYCLVTGGGAARVSIGQSTRRDLPEEERPAPPWQRMKLPGHNPRGPEGSGLPFDMGGYYLHNLINMFGNINRVAGYCKAQSPQKTSLDPLNTMYKEFVPTPDPSTLVGSLEFDSGVLGSVQFVSDVGGRPDQQFVVFGTEATMYCPDPNFFGGDIVLQTYSGKPMVFDINRGFLSPERYTIPTWFGYNDQSRGVGLMDLAFAIRNGRKPRCHYSMGLQAFECVHGMIDSCENGVQHKMVSHCERPKAVQPGVRGGGFGSTEFEQQSCFDD